MTIAQRLWVMVGFTTLMFMALGGLSMWVTSSMVTKGNDIAQLSELQNKMTQLMGFSLGNREQLMLALQHNPADATLSALHDHAIDRHFEKFAETRKQSKEVVASFKGDAVVEQIVAQEMKTFLEARSAYGQEGVDVGFNLIKEGKYHQATEHLLKVINPAYSRVHALGLIVSNILIQKHHQLHAENEQLNQRMSIILVIAVIIALVLGLLLAWLVIRSIKNSIDQVNVTLMNAAGSMQFTARLPERRDEFSTVSSSVNRLFGGLQQGLDETRQVVQALASGDMGKRMSGQYMGDLAALKQGVNQSADNISQVIAELSRAMEAIKNGQFEIRLNTQAQGVYGKMLVDAATAMSDIHRVMADINNIMHQMNEANFNARVNAEARGDLLLLKDNMNASMSSMENIIKSIVTVVGAQALGDLTKELPSGMFKGQLHDLKNAINFSSAKVKESVNQAVDASSIVNEAATQVAQGANDLSSRVQQQAAALEETSATMNEMSAAVQANTASARRVAELAHQVQNQAGAGVDVMQKTISAMQSIKESSGKIADIVTLIDGIAFQTNLLALNAAVEAARAGEHGRGFAVVAGEVRALAQKSANAAKDIKDLITDSVARIEAGTQLADKSGEMLSGITGSIEQVANMIEEIASASGEQAEGIHQVNLAVLDIDRMTQENAALVEQTHAASESLTSEANHLITNMSFFKTGTTSHAHYQRKASHKMTVKPSAGAGKPMKGLPIPANAGHSNEWSDF